VTQFSVFRPPQSAELWNPPPSPTTNRGSKSQRNRRPPLLLRKTRYVHTAALTNAHADRCLPQDLPSADRVEEKGATDGSPSEASSSRRVTRSQTGTVPKRRQRADSDTQPPPKKRAAAPRKKQKPSATPPSDASDAQEASSSEAALPPPPSTTTSAPPSVQPSRAASVQASSHQDSPASEDQTEAQLPRSRAALPVPIPNLTKKSRGRRVPTKDAAPGDPTQKDSRLYVCTVEGCGKCFHRGEHLKRHIRSIHTHEKR